MDIPLASTTQHDLLTELDSVERDIARSSTFQRCADQDGRTRVRVTPELLLLAEREHLIVAELRRRQQVPSVAGLGQHSPSMPTRSSVADSARSRLTVSSTSWGTLQV